MSIQVTIVNRKSPKRSITVQVSITYVLDVIHGQKFRTWQRRTREVYLTIWPPHSQRKCMAEMKQNKIQHVLAYREQVPRSGRVLESFLGYFDKLVFINKCYWACFSSRLEISFFHPKQILVLCSRQHNRDIPSAAIAWRKAPYDVLFHQFSPAMLISSLCFWF